MGLDRAGKVRGHRYRPKSRIGRTVQIAVLLALVAPLAAVIPDAFADEPTASQDALRTGWDPTEPNLGPATITGSNFGQLFATPVTGQVYAQPLVIGDTVVVNTEDNWVYGLDAATGTVRWSRQLGPAWPSARIGCADLTPNLGSTSTGVYDPASDTVYVTTKVDDGKTNGVYDPLAPNWYLHAISASTGAERPSWPLRIAGTPSNDPVHPFVGKDTNQRPGLLLMNGVVYLAFGSQCDYGSYVGWVVGVNTTTQATNVWSDEAGPSSSRAGIWHGGGGIVSDGPGRLFVSTGNGITAPDGPGSTPPLQLSQSVIRLGVAGNGVISAQDFFSPSNAAQLDLNDQDLGSGGPVALPAQYFGTPGRPNLMVEIGKDGRLFLLDRDHLGGKAQGAGGTDDVIQTVGPNLGVWGHPAAYGGEGGYVYVVQNSGPMLAFRYGVDGQGHPALSLAGNSSESFGYTSGSPAVTSDGVNPGSAVVWVVGVDGPNGANARLCGYAAVPVSSHLALLRCFPIGTGVKFSTPATANGRVYVGTRDGHVYGFGQPAASALNAVQTTFGNVTVSATGRATVVATARRDVTITAVTAAAPFSATPPAAGLPLDLTAGQTVSVDVGFSPTSPGSFTGALRFSYTEHGVPGGYGAALQGTAIKPGFTATPAQLSFGNVSVGGQRTLTASFTNTGTASETVTGFTGPAGPFSLSGAAPVVGSTLSPGQAVTVGLTYTPGAVGTDTGQISLTGANGTATTTLAGNGVTGQAQLTISPTSLDFGLVPVGLSAARTLTISNTGDLPVTITKAAPPALPFVVATPLAEGQVLGPDDSVQVTVSFAPSAAGAVAGSYAISSDDGQGQHLIPVTGTGVNGAGPALPSVYGGGWVLNGAATMSSAGLMLTPATASRVGSAVYTAPVPSQGLKATFTATIGGGTGGEGMTFAMLAASGATPKSIGVGGAGLGFLNLPGVAVTLDTNRTGNDPSSNFLGLTKGGSNGLLTYVAKSTSIPSLRTGTHTVVVTAGSGKVSVWLDGTLRISAAVTLPASVLPAFTGSTGTRTDKHIASKITISSGGTTLAAPGTGWRYNGAATTSTGQVILTPATRQAAGSVFWSAPVQTNGTSAQFTLTTNGGTGADGSTFALLDPAQHGATSLGTLGAGLGFAGLAGVAVAFVTYPQNGIGSHNFVAVLTSTKGGPATLVGSSTNLPDLRAASRSVAIVISGKTLSVSVDGSPVLSATVPSLPPTAIVGFSAATGGITDVHRIAGARVVPGPLPLPQPPAAGWTDNGSATTSGGTLQLTDAVPNQTGSAIYATAVPTGRLDARFTVQIGGGTGADGLAFVLLDSTKTTKNALGQGGGGLGFSGLPGVAVTFVTYQHTGEPSNNFVGISTTGSGRALTYLATSTAVPQLRDGTHQVEIVVGAGGHLVVSVDATKVLDQVVAVPAKALVGFTGATGGFTDGHAVSSINILY